MTRFENQRFAAQCDVAAQERQRLSGWCCNSCGEVTFDIESVRCHAASGDALVLEARKRQQEKLKRVRHKLELTRQPARIPAAVATYFSR